MVSSAFTLEVNGGDGNSGRILNYFQRVIVNMIDCYIAYEHEKEVGVRKTPGIIPRQMNKRNHLRWRTLDWRIGWGNESKSEFSVAHRNYHRTLGSKGLNQKVGKYIEKASVVRSRLSLHEKSLELLRNDQEGSLLWALFKGITGIKKSATNSVSPTVSRYQRSRGMDIHRYSTVIRKPDREAFAITASISTLCPHTWSWRTAHCRQEVHILITLFGNRNSRRWSKKGT